MRADASSLARAIVRAEIGPSEPATSAAVAVGAHEIWAKLGRHFSRLLGEHGTQVLLDRGVVLAARTYPWLSAARSTAEADAADTLRASLEHRDASEAANALVQVVGELISLLQRCIGNLLVGRLLAELWDTTDHSGIKELS